MWLTAIAYFGILAGLYSFGLFLPTIIQGLDIVDTPNQVQLWSVIPYAVATVCTGSFALSFLEVNYILTTVSFHCFRL